MASSDFPLHLLQSTEQLQLLNDIDKLRSDGVHYHDISLPQLVVCGDQSSGKSSVLEALSNVKFPVDKGTCTRFAMELALRRSPDEKHTAKIIPGRNASADRQRRLADFKAFDVGLAGVPELIAKAREAMGLSGDHAICDDVLRLEITGPDLPHLTLVDLPGLIADAKDTKDIELVENLVKTYMKNPRSIILAIISAQNDKQNQKVLRLAREFDPRGDRTVGIITKPDMLKNYRGSVAERTYLEMAKNQDPVSKLRLGWHVVRNPDYHEKQKDSTYNRDEMEMEIFSHEPWNELSKWQLGIGSLRDELTKHLFNQICSELPRVVQDIEREEAKCEQELKELGDVRVTKKDQQKYLIGISRRFEQLVGAGLEGHWTFDPIFNVESMRLRAQVRNSNDAFERVMKTNGHTFEFIPAGNHNLREPLSSGGFGADPVVANRAILLRKADKILKSGRGQELPGMFDPILVSDIFRDQSKKWQGLAHEHAEKVWQIVNQFLHNLLFKIAPSRTSTAEAILKGIVSGEMLHRKKSLDAKIAELLLPYVKNMPFCTPSRMAASLKQIDLDGTDAERLESTNTRLNGLVGSEIDVDACSTLLRYSQAYYNVARDTFIDNVATLAIENCLLAELANIFSSDMILDMEDGQLANLAGESEKILSDRKYAEEKSRVLKQSLKTCRAHMSRRPALREDSQRDLVQEAAGFSISADVNPPGSGLFGAPVQVGNQTILPHKGLVDGKPGDAPLSGGVGLAVTEAPVNGPPSSTGSLRKPTLVDTLTSSTSLFHTSASSNAPSSSTSLSGQPASSTSLFTTSAPVNTLASGTPLVSKPASVNTPTFDTSSVSKPASVSTPTFGTSSVSKPAPVNTPTFGTSSVSKPASVNTPTFGTSSVSKPASVNTPAFGTSLSGTSASANPPTSNTSPFGTSASVNPFTSRTSPFGTPALVNPPTSSTSLFGFGSSASTNPPTSSTSPFGTLASVNPPTSSTSPFSTSASVNPPTSSTSLSGFGSSASANPPTSSTSPFSTSASVNTLSSGTPLFGRDTSTSRSTFRGFGGLSQTEASSLKEFLNKPAKGFTDPDMPPKPAFNDDIPGGRLPSKVEGAPSTAPTKTTSSQPTPSSSVLPAPTVQAKKVRIRVRLPAPQETSEIERRIVVICESLSQMAIHPYIIAESDVRKVLLQCVSGAFSANEYGRKAQSFEELRLDDRKKLEDSEISQFIHKCNPDISGHRLTPWEIENWCRSFMASQIAEGKVEYPRKCDSILCTSCHVISGSGFK